MKWRWLPPSSQTEAMLGTSIARIPPGRSRRCVQFGSGVIEVFEHLQRHDGVEVAVREEIRGERGRANVEVEEFPGVEHSTGRRLDAHDVPAGLACRQGELSQPAPKSSAPLSPPR